MLRTFLISLFICSCSASRVNPEDLERLFRMREYRKAAFELEETMKDEGPESRDGLLHFLNLGLAYHYARDFEKATKTFLKSDELADIKDYTSLTNEALTFMVSDSIKHFRAEEFEFVTISLYLALDFASMGNSEGALVEVRKMHRKVNRLVTEAGRNYPEVTLAHYLSAILYEREKQWDDAWLEYKKVSELNPDLRGIGADLWRIARARREKEAAREIETKFSLSSEEKSETLKLIDKNPSLGELIVIFENGWAPVKQPIPEFPSIPRFVTRYFSPDFAVVEIDGKNVGNTVSMYDIQGAAIRNLEQKFAGILGKKVAGRIAKEVVAQTVESETKNPMLGALTRMILLSVDHADTRSWQMLPRDIHIFRYALSPGTYNVSIAQGLQRSETRAVTVGAGEKVIFNDRIF